MIHKKSRAGIGYSVLDLKDVRHVVATAVPRSGHTLKQQTQDALHTIEALMEEKTTQGAIVNQAVFIKDPTLKEQCRQLMRDFYGSDLPATTYICQPPCEGKLISLEAFGICQSTGDVEIERISENLVVTRYDNVAWAHCGQITPDTQASSVYDRSSSAFRRMEQVLAARGFQYNQIFRTWLYVGDIVGPEGETQRYKEINRARADFYQDIRFLSKHVPSGFNHSVFPASTGIGMSCSDMVMSCIALDTKREDIILLPLENPKQTAAFDYETSYGPKSPKFSRAMAVINDPYAYIFISGTASITQSKTRFIDDVRAQTIQTLDNIEALISEENFCRHNCPGYGGTLEQLALARVYIKNQDDYAQTRPVVEKRLGELPTVYAQADVCRSDLLVEIEGIAVTQLQK